MGLEVISVDRENGGAQRVIIETEGKRIIFVLVDGELRESGRIRLDGRRIIGSEPNWISPVAYSKATRTAAAILRQKARR